MVAQILHWLVVFADVPYRFLFLTYIHGVLPDFILHIVAIVNFIDLSSVSWI